MNDVVENILQIMF